MLKPKYFVLLFLSFQSIAQTKKITVTDLTKIKQAISISASPDGTQAFYSLKTMEVNTENKEEYDYRNHLYLINAQNQSKALTRGVESISQPVWAPDSKSIAFVRFVKTKPQVFIMPLDGGEAWQLTTYKNGATNPTFSPDGSKIIFSSGFTLTELLKDSVMNNGGKLPAWSIEKPGLSNEQALVKSKAKANPDGNLEEIRAYLAKDVEDKKARVFNRMDFQGEASADPEMYFSHLFCIEVKEKATEKALTKGYVSNNEAAWTPDGKSIYYISSADSTQHPDRLRENALMRMNADGSNKKIVLAEAYKSFNSIEMSGDGKLMAITKQTVNKLSFTELEIINLENLKAETVNFDRSTNKYEFSKDSKTLFITANSNGGIPFYKYDLKARKLEQISDFNSGVLAFSTTKDKVYFVKTEISNPCEIYVSDLGMKKPVQITNLNTEWLAGKTISVPEKRLYTNTLGQKVDYWLMKPSNLEANKKYPLLLNMHGGPTAMWGPGEFSMWHEFQYFAAQGYGVVYANPRGSSGYGQAFQFANYRDWGVGPSEDVLAAATDAAKEAWVDTAKQVITGGSYAGYLAAWIVSHDNRFKAAFAQRGVYDLKTFMGEGNAWRLTPNYFGLPWEAEETTKIEFNSPYNYVDKIKTPLLIKHGENDLRTGVIQSEMMYKSMKYLGKQVEYVRMPGATHELSRTGNVRQRIDRMLRIYEFFERFVGK